MYPFRRYRHVQHTNSPHFVLRLISITAVRAAGERCIPKLQHSARRLATIPRVPYNTGCGIDLSITHFLGRYKPTLSLSMATSVRIVVMEGLILTLSARIICPPILVIIANDIHLHLLRCHQKLVPTALTNSYQNSSPLSPASSILCQLLFS